MLEQEFQYYIDHQDELVQTYQGKFLLISGEEVKGAYDNETDAYLDGKKRFGLGNFLLQYCSPGKDSYTRKFRNRLIVPAWPASFVQKYLNNNVRAFTVHSNGLAAELVSSIWISEFIEPGEISPWRFQEIKQKHEYKCVWDTGAMDTCITPRIVQELGLVPTGRRQFQGVGAAGQEGIVHDAYTYLVNLYFPHRVIIHGVTVSDAEPGGCDVLLGMDVIRVGDLAISNFKGQTAFTFRTPSIEKIDFVQEINSLNEKMAKSPKSIEQKRKDKNKRKQARKDRKSK